MRTPPGPHETVPAAAPATARGCPRTVVACVCGLLVLVLTCLAALAWALAHPGTVAREADWWSTVAVAAALLAGAALLASLWLLFAPSAPRVAEAAAPRAAVPAPRLEEPLPEPGNVDADEVLAAIADAFLTVDDQWRLTYANGAARRLLGLDECAPGATLWELAEGQPLAGEEAATTLRRAMERRSTANGEVQAGDSWWHVRAYPAGAGLALYVHDMTARKLSEAKLRYLAEHDALTGLANRLQFQARLWSELVRDGCGALLLIDLDFFKDVNDRHGHVAGDALLRALAENLQAVVRSEDLLARIGGDEFALLAAGIADDEVEGLAMRIMGCADTTLGPTAEPVSLSIGITAYDHRDNDVERVMANADHALYRVKEQGRGGWAQLDHADGSVQVHRRARSQPQEAHVRAGTANRPMHVVGRKRRGRMAERPWRG